MFTLCSHFEHTTCLLLQMTCLFQHTQLFAVPFFTHFTYIISRGISNQDCLSWCQLVSVSRVQKSCEDNYYLGCYNSQCVIVSFSPLFLLFLANFACFVTQLSDGFCGLVVSMLASGTQVCRFKPGRSCWIFTDVKILSMQEVKESVPCHSSAACKRT